jgi:hypothetical protein
MRRGAKRASLRRQAVAAPAQTRLRAKTFPAPVNGWVLDENLATAGPGSAAIMENWIPTTKGARVRGGAFKYQSVSTSEILSFLNYKSGATEKLFVADETNIFDISTATTPDTLPTGIVQGQTAGYYSSHQFGTSGGDFLIAVNGADIMWQYDGTNWYPVNGVAVNTLDYDGGTVAFARGETVTGAGGANATILAINGDAASGTLYIGPVTSGPFVDDEVLTGSVAGAAVADGAESALSSVTITNVNTDDLSQVWSFASRLFFVEEDTMSAWYLPVNAIGGAAAELRFSSIFQKGGSLLFGASWSIDAGDGPDDLCVFVSTEGEVLVYQGTDPSSASTWSQVGRYDIGKPLGIKATMKAGGDLLVATDVGLVSLSMAINKDVVALSKTGVSKPVYPAWADYVTQRGDLSWEIAKWTVKSFMVVSLPRSNNALDAECLVVNLETGKWGHIVGWDTRCVAIYDDRGFFGANDGNVYEMERGGSDNGSPYTCTYVGQFDHMDMPEVTKTAMQARAVFKAAGPFNYKLSASANYLTSLPAAPSSSDDYISSQWDVGLWDEAIWDGSTTTYAVTSQWVSIGKTGYTLAPQIQITLGVTPTPTIELVSFVMTYNAGGIVV